MIILLISPQKPPIKLPPGQEPTTSTHGSSVHPLNYPSIQKKQHPLLSPHFFFYLLIDPLCQKKIPLNKKQKIPFFFTPFFSYNQSKTKTKTKIPQPPYFITQQPFHYPSIPSKNAYHKTHTYTHKQKKISLPPTKLQNHIFVYILPPLPTFNPAASHFILHKAAPLFKIVLASLFPPTVLTKQKKKEINKCYHTLHTHAPLYA